MADPNSMMQGPAGSPYGTLYRPPQPTQPLGAQSAYDANGAPPAPQQSAAAPPQPPAMTPPSAASPTNTSTTGLGSGNPQVPSSPFDGHNPNSFLSRMFGMSGSQSQQPFVHPNSLVGRFAHLFY